MDNKIVIKQDVNFLDKPLWFLDSRKTEGFIWKDIDGYEYRSGYKPPDKVDILILLYLLYKCQKNNYEPFLELSHYEILKKCDLPYTNPKYYKRLEDSLKRWKNVSIEFKGTFYNGEDYDTLLFSIINKGSIRKKDKKVVVEFNKEWLLKIRESNFFKYVNFHHYKALKRPISRRLHEILCTKFFSRKTWPIKLTKLGEKLTFSGRKRKGKHVIFASDVLVAIKPAINEINKLAKNKELAKKAGIKPKDLFTISYQITGEKQDRVIVFHRCSVEEKQSKEKTSLKQTSQELLDLLKKRTKKLETQIQKYLEKEGFEYVKGCILYANQKSKKNYSTYLQQVLQNNWAEEWVEEEKTKAQQRLVEQEERERKEREEKQKEEKRKQAEQQRPAFCQAVAELDEQVKQGLWNQAEKEIPKNMCRREFNVKILYAELVLECLNRQAEQGERFAKQVLNDFGLISDIAWKG